MDCRDVTAAAVARFAGEADEATRSALAAHLASCEACRAEVARLEEAWNELGLDPDATISPEFRRRTLELLEEEMLRLRVRSFRPRRRALAPLAQAAALAVAVGAGFFAARTLPTAAPGAASGPAVSSPVAGPARIDLGSSPRLSNVAYRAETDGRVGIGFDVTTRHNVMGRPEDREVARLLAYLVSRNAETAGEKSRAIDLVSEHYTGAMPASPEIVAALANTLRKDANPGVRKKAADALASFPMTPDIRTVLLDALASDKNPAVRLAALEALAAAARQSPDPRTIESLREKAVDPQENNFVRARAASALKAISF